MEEQEALLTAEEAAELLRVHPNTVYRLLQEGELPGRKVGGTWRLPREALEQWIAKQPPFAGW